MARYSTVRQRPPSLQEDTFVSGVLEATDWTRRHGRLLVIALVTLLLVIAGTLYYRHYRTVLESRANSELMQVRQIAASGNLPLAVRQLRGFVSRYGGTHAGSEGRMLLAQALLDQGDAKGAVPVIEPLASDMDDPLGPPAAFLLGAAYEGSNNHREAEATYLHIADKTRFEFQREDALESAARLKLQDGDATGAAALYQRILTQMPDTATGRQVYEMRLAEAQAQSQSARK